MNIPGDGVTVKRSIDGIRANVCQGFFFQVFLPILETGRDVANGGMALATEKPFAQRPPRGRERRELLISLQKACHGQRSQVILRMVGRSPRWRFRSITPEIGSYWPHK